MVSELSPNEKDKTTTTETPEVMQKRQDAFNAELEPLLLKHGFELGAQAVIVMQNGKSTIIPNGMIAARPLLMNKPGYEPAKVEEAPKDEVVS